MKMGDRRKNLYLLKGYLIVDKKWSRQKRKITVEKFCRDWEKSAIVKIMVFKNMTDLNFEKGHLNLKKSPSKKPFYQK